MRKEGRRPPPTPNPAEDEVSANGDKPSAGNEHFCGKLASSAFSSLSSAHMRKREGEGKCDLKKKKGDKNELRGMRDLTR